VLPNSWAEPGPPPRGLRLPGLQVGEGRCVGKARRHTGSGALFVVVLDCDCWDQMLHALQIRLR